MIWISRVAFLFAGFIVAGVFCILYFMVSAFFSVFLLGINNETFHTLEYWLCVAAGFVTAFFLMRKGWPKVAPSKQPTPTDLQF